MITIKLALCALVLSLTGNAASVPAPAASTEPRVSLPDSTDDAVEMSCQSSCLVGRNADVAYCVAHYIGGDRIVCIRLANEDYQECLAGC